MPIDADKMKNVASDVVQTTSDSPIIAGAAIGAGASAINGIVDYLRERRNLLKMLDACTTKECKDSIRTELEILKQNALERGLLVSGAMGTLGGIGGHIYRQLNTIKDKSNGGLVTPSIFKIDGAVYDDSIPLYKKIGLPMLIAAPAAAAAYATGLPVESAYARIGDKVAAKIAAKGGRDKAGKALKFLSLILRQRH